MMHAPLWHCLLGRGLGRGGVGGGVLLHSGGASRGKVGGSLVHLVSNAVGGLSNTVASLVHGLRHLVSGLRSTNNGSLDRVESRLQRFSCTVHGLLSSSEKGVAGGACGVRISSVRSIAH